MNQVGRVATKATESVNDTEKDPVTGSTISPEYELFKHHPLSLSLSLSLTQSLSHSLNHNDSYFLPSLVRSLLFTILYRSTIARFQRFLLFQTERIFVVEINLFLPVKEIYKKKRTKGISDVRSIPVKIDIFVFLRDSTKRVKAPLKRSANRSIKKI